MDNILNKRKEVLQETVEYYSKNRRSIDYDEDGEWGYCSYSGVNCKFISEGDPIGRRIRNTKAVEIDKIYGEVGVHHVWDMLPNNIKILGLDFWIQISVLHDNCMFWENGGLSEEGFEFVKEIEDKYCTKKSENSVEIKKTNSDFYYIKTTDWENLTKYKPLRMVI